MDIKPVLTEPNSQLPAVPLQVTHMAPLNDKHNAPQPPVLQSTNQRDHLVPASDPQPTLTGKR